MKKVLVGESNYAEFEVLNDYLTGKGFDVHWVKNGNDAVEAFQQHHPDLLILDALLPGLTGLKVCQKIRQLPEGADVKTILMSKVYQQFKEQYESRKTVGVDAYTEKPVNVAELDKLLTQFVGEAEPEAVAPAPEPTSQVAVEQSPTGRRRMKTSGQLSETPFPRLLYYLFKYKRTGALRVAHERTNKIVYVREGVPVTVTSNLSGESLGRYMVRSGLITDEQYNSSLEKMLETGKQQGAVLLEMGMITPHQLFQGVEGQTREKLLRLFSWDEGEYEFRPGTFSLDESALIRLPTLQMLLEGIKRYYTLARLEKFFNEYKNQRLRRMKKSFLAGGAMTLAPQEANFFKLIDGKRTVGNIVAQSALSLSQTFQLLYYLLLTQAIRFVSDADFDTRGVKMHEAYTAERRRRHEEMRGLQDDRRGVIGQRLKQFKRLIIRTHGLLDQLNHYELLKLTPGAGPDRIRQAYLSLVNQYRPYDLYQQVDEHLQQESNDIFNRLTDAYETLSDPRRRRAYDARLEIPLVAPEEPAAEPAAEPAEEAPPIVAPPPRPIPPRAEPESVSRPEPQVEERDLFPPEEPGGEEVESLDLDWDIEDELAAESIEDTSQTLEDFVDEDEARKVAEAGQVTASVAAQVKGELAFQQGEDALSRRDYATAKAKFAEAWELNPNEAEYAANLGYTMCLAAPNRPEALAEGRALLEKAIAINPVLDVAYLLLGLVNLLEGNADRARQNFRSVLQHNPDNRRAADELKKLETR